jgi:hypothetical protein
LSSRYTPVHAHAHLRRNARKSAGKRLSLVAATAVAAAGMGAAAASAGTIPWSNAMSNLSFETHATSLTNHTATAAFDGLIEPSNEPATHLSQAQKLTASVELNSRYVAGSDIGIAGTLRFGAPISAAGTTAYTIGTSTGLAVSTPPTAQGHTTQASAVPSKPKPTDAASAHATTANATAAAARKASAPAHAAPAHAAPAHAAPAHHAQAPAAPAQPYIFYDSVTPTAIPAGQEVATYADGNYAATPASVAGRTHVLWIDTNGSDPSADALDIEPGDATPVGAAQWVQAKLSADHGATAILYTMISEWQAVKDNVAALPNWMQSHVRYWIADPTGVPHVVPGSNATQWYWGNSYDISTANPGF